MNKSDIIYGVRPVIEALESDRSIDRIFIKRELDSAVSGDIIKKAKLRDIPVLKVPQEKLNRLVRSNHQGVIAIVSPVIYSDLENVIADNYERGKSVLGLVLDGITDTRNFGAIARTAECAGASFIVIPKKNSVSITSDAVRASAGALLHIPVCRVDDLSATYRILKENGLKIIGASEKAAINYTDIDMEVPTVIVMGSEYDGLSQVSLRACDELAAIPILGKVGSLNVGIASAIMLYEAVRQRKDA